MKGLQVHALISNLSMISPHIRPLHAKAEMREQAILLPLFMDDTRWFAGCVCLLDESRHGARCIQVFTCWLYCVLNMFFFLMVLR